VQTASLQAAGYGNGGDGFDHRGRFGEAKRIVFLARVRRRFTAVFENPPGEGIAPARAISVGLSGEKWFTIFGPFEAVADLPNATRKGLVFPLTPAEDRKRWGQVSDPPSARARAAPRAGRPF